MSRQYPWDLKDVPNYSVAPGVEIEHANELDPKRFWTKYVAANRPCLIKDAVADWPAHTLWGDSEYLLDKVGDIEVRASCRPKVERFGLRSEERDAVASRMTQENLLPPEKVRTILPRLKTRNDDVLFIELRPTDSATRRLEDDLWSHGERFRFLPHPARPRFLYSVWAAMFYKNSYSDWHFHPGTEAIMCQVMGGKEVLLLPPNERAWQVIVPIHRRKLEVYAVDQKEFPNFGNIQPLRVVVESGDGLFIPVNWWHAVQAPPQEFGVTVPLSWDSKYCDLRQPATRHFLGTLWRTQKPLAIKMFVEASQSTVSNQIRSSVVG